MKKQKWQSVTYVDPNTGRLSIVEAPARGCPNCGQSRCTRNNVVCLAVCDAIKQGKRSFFYM